jgi:hypothetical protein
LRSEHPLRKVHAGKTPSEIEKKTALYFDCCENILSALRKARVGLICFCEFLLVLE